MTDEEVKVLTSVRKMIGVITANVDVFKNNTKVTSVKDALNTDIGVLEAAGAAGVSSRGAKLNATADKTSAEIALERFLRKFVSTGKIIKKSEPEFDNTFVMRRGNYGSQELLDTARAFLNDLTTAAVAKFDEYGFKSATVANLQAKIEAFEAASAQQNIGIGSGIAATAETKAAIRRIRANRLMLKEVGENIIEDIDDAGLIAEWKSACKIEKKKSTPPATPPTT